eukprot:scaffold7_cov378-Prasinococcus_capsulatus_cf.AAC.18
MDCEPPQGGQKGGVVLPSAVADRLPPASRPSPSPRRQWPSEPCHACGATHAGRILSADRGGRRPRCAMDQRIGQSARGSAYPEIRPPPPNHTVSRPNRRPRLRGRATQDCADESACARDVRPRRTSPPAGAPQGATTRAAWLDSARRAAYLGLGWTASARRWGAGRSGARYRAHRRNGHALSSGVLWSAAVTRTRPVM